MTTAGDYNPYCKRKKMEKEFNLSEKITYNGAELGSYDVIKVKDIKEFIKRREKENKDLELDIFNLIDIEKDMADLQVKLHRLFKAHKEEIDKLAGEKFAQG